MERNTIIAIVLSLFIILGFGIFQSRYTQARNIQIQQTVQEVAQGESAPVRVLPAPVTAVSLPGSSDTQVLTEQRITISTGKVTATLTNAGGDIVSYRLSDHDDRGKPVDMIFSGNSEAHTFTLALGPLYTTPLDTLFNIRRISDLAVEFYRDFVIPGEGGEEQSFRLTKRYDFKPQEYMFELTVSLDGAAAGAAAAAGFNFGGAAYTLGFGPQFGPKFETLDNRGEYRRYYTFTNGKLKTEKVGNTPLTIDTRVSWASMAGKYFAFIAIPAVTNYRLNFSSAPEPGLPAASRFHLVRGAVENSRTIDVYRFYLGPKNQEILSNYDDNTYNGYGLSGMALTKILNTSGILAPVEAILKVILNFFYGMVHNYGVAIILLTLFVRLMLFPLTKKQSESAQRMQAMNPRVKEIQTKYKENPQKMNAELTALYKAEGYNPAGGCLPMLIQIPIFFAMYNLFNTHFDLRGASFIPGWISDLSIPESIWNFAPFRLPILGWSDLRLLPIIYVASQLFSPMITMTPDQANNPQTKIMIYLLPVVFFFVLYNTPSGLLLYWIMSNLMGLAQQLLMKALTKKSPPPPVSTERLVIAPKKKKR